MKLFCELFVIFILFLLRKVESKHCTYIYESGYMKYFFCNAYEYCCGTMCCPSQALTFYQLWYFWLMVIMILLLCSGGSWWYRFRHQAEFINPSMAASNLNPTQRFVPVQTGVPYGSQSATPAPMYSAHQQPISTQLPSTGQQYPPPPPYYGPPPSYYTVVNQQSS